MDPDLSLKYILIILKRNILFLIFVSFIFLISAYMLTTFIIKLIYISSVKLYVVPNSYIKQVLTPNLNDLNYVQKVVNTYIEFLKINIFYEKVANEVD